MNIGESTEQQFEQAFAKYGKKAYVFRLPDTKEIQGRTKSNSWIRKQPSDYIVTLDGSMFYAEVKSCGSKTSFPFSQIEKGQMNAAKRSYLAGGQYYFFVHNTNTGIWYKIPAGVILNSKKKSLKWDELKPYKWVV